VPVIAVPPQYTSQDCSKCGVEVKKTLSTRTHSCPHCGHVQDRDWNAAINILKKALQYWAKNTVGHTEINASGEHDLCAVRKPNRVSRLVERGNPRSDSWSPLYNYKRIARSNLEGRMSTHSLPIVVP
jgi:hypothetical protein